MRIEHTATIPAPPAELFRLTTDVEAWPSFLQTVTSVERLDAGPLRPGSRARIKQPGLRRRVWTVTELEAPTRFVWRAPFLWGRFVARHLVEPDADGTSRNHLVLELEGRGMGAVGRVVRARLLATLETENAAFAAEAERRRSA